MLAGIFKLVDMVEHVTAIIYFHKMETLTIQLIKYILENIVKKAVDKGQALDVVIKFERSTPNSPRPDKLRVMISVEGSKYRYVNVFKNQYGGGK